MKAHLRANLSLVILTLLFCSVVYPGLLLIIGRFAFPSQAEGSLVYRADGKPLGSRLIAQPFRGDEYFQPRPSAASYNAAASAASNWGANNYLLRERVARQIGPIAKYSGGQKPGQPVGPDVESWFARDSFEDKPGIVGQWARRHPAVAQNWLKEDPLNADYVAAWQRNHSDEVAAWRKSNRENSEPKPEDLAVPFFESFSKAHPGRFPVAVEQKTADGRIVRRIELRGAGTEVQGIFFDMWRQEHPHVQLQPLPSDMVLASGSGLDPHITLENALYQSDRVAKSWADRAKRPVSDLRWEIENLLREKAEAPLGGLVGPKLVNVLEINVALAERYR